MSGSLAAVYLLMFTLTVSSPAQEKTTSPNNSMKNLREQVKQMQRNAHTPEQYNALASTYSRLKDAYLKQAQEEKLEWERREANTTSISAKYPRPVDSSRNRYEYLMEQAKEMWKRAESFSKQASGQKPN